MDEAKRIGREAFLIKYAAGYGSDNWYVEDAGVQYDLKALWAAAHCPAIAPTSFQTYAAKRELTNLGFACVSGVATPTGLPGDVGYLFSHSPPAIASLDDELIRPVKSPLAAPGRKLSPTGYWLFLANPARWKGEEWLLTGERDLLYLVSIDDRRFIQPGDLGLIRLNKTGGAAARFLAAVDVLETPSVMPEPNAQFFSDATEGRPKLRTRLSVISAPGMEPVSALSLPRRPEFKYMHGGIRRTTIAIERSAFLPVAKALGLDGRTLTALRESRSPGGVRRVEQALGNLTPVQKERVSKVIERGPVGNAVKAIRQGRCQICEGLGAEPVAFTKSDGSPYAEAHHVIPVAELQHGSLHPQNIMVLCPNHHRQAHYGSFIVQEDMTDSWIVVIDGKRLRVEKTTLPGDCPLV